MIVYLIVYAPGQTIGLQPLSGETIKNFHFLTKLFFSINCYTYICYNKEREILTFKKHSMKTLKSKIATIQYKNYSENVDMLNPLFKQSELDKLTNTDKDIKCVVYRVNGKVVNIVDQGKSNIEVTLTIFEGKDKRERESNERAILFGNKVKLFHMVQDWRDCFKTIRESGKGKYISFFGSRHYITDVMDHKGEYLEGVI